MTIYRFYKIYNPNIKNSLTYIGQTTQTLIRRFQKHKTTFNNIEKYKYTENSKKVFEIYGLENCIIELIEEIETKCYNEIKQKERYLIEITPNCVNKIHPSKTPLEWREEHKNKQKEYMKTYYLNNKDKYLKNK